MKLIFSISVAFQFIFNLVPPFSISKYVNMTDMSLFNEAEGFCEQYFLRFVGFEDLKDILHLSLMSYFC